jgi:hypothetical protein
LGALVVKPPSDQKFNQLEKVAVRLVECFFNSFRLAVQSFYILANILLFVGMLCYYRGTFPKNEVGIKVLVVLAPSSKTVGSLMKTIWPVKPARKMI